MHNSNPDFLWFFAIAVVVVIAVFIISNIQQSKRTVALTAIAPTIGFTFHGTDWTDASKSPSLQTALFDKGHSQRFKNIMTGTFDGFVTSVFDYWFTTGGGKSSHTWSQTVVAFSQNSWLPLFELRTENLMDRIADAFTHKDIDFSSHPEFSHRFLLRGADEQHIKETFTPALLSFLEGLPSEEKWHLEGDGNTLILYRSDVLAEPEEIRSLLEDTSSIAKGFLRCCGERSAKLNTT